jgi:hypothetical protein
MMLTLPALASLPFIIVIGLIVTFVLHRFGVVSIPYFTPDGSDVTPPDAATGGKATATDDANFLIEEIRKVVKEEFKVQLPDFQIPSANPAAKVAVVHNADGSVSTTAPGVSVTTAPAPKTA